MRRSMEAGPSDAGAPSEEWQCPACTFRNASDAARCDMCGTSRGVSDRRARARPASLCRVRRGAQVASRFPRRCRIRGRSPRLGGPQRRRLRNDIRIGR